MPSGSTPSRRHAIARAYSMTNSAGWVTAVCASRCSAELFAARLGIEHVAQVEAELRAQDRRALVDLGAEAGIAVVQARAPCRRTAPPGRGTGTRPTRPRRCSEPVSVVSGSSAPSRCDGLVGSRGHDGPAVGEPPPARLQRERHVGERVRRVVDEMVAQARRGRVEGRRRPGRKHEQLLVVVGPGRGSATGASSSTTWAFVPPTPNELTPARRGEPSGDCHGRSERDDAERRVLEIELRVRRGEVQARRERLVVQGQRRLDEAGDAGGRVEVADVALDRSDRAEARFGRAAGAERLGEPRDLDRDRRAAWRFRGPRRRRSSRGSIPASAWASAMTPAWPSTLGAVKLTFEAPSLFIAGALDDGVDRVAVLERVAQPPQRDDARRRC